MTTSDVILYKMATAHAISCQLGILADDVDVDGNNTFVLENKAVYVGWIFCSSLLN